ncbi:acyl-CoA thioesterase [Aestuariibacter sp. GS-14]|uniref:acyl-CoA thioesterase n=1 Tax=Aestuariibacter sp. GS-14 TaxID=2590670 RepID=UPI00112D059D|nr:acyl-CoA thioesterase [Aestuariibacter sp. GS-14]TPV60722.1 acyl-CoA thioesterase [Aestuariibacter sp. GS-14]
MSDISPWQYPNPFVVTWKIQEQDIDHYQHVNNVAYLSQQENVAWQHSRSLGLSFEHYKELDRAMVIVRHELDYVKPAFRDDELHCATWIVACDGRLQLTREFQYIRASTGDTLYRGKTRFICVKLSSGQPARMPRPFADIYQGAVIPQIQG